MTSTPTAPAPPVSPHARARWDRHDAGDGVVRKLLSPDALRAARGRMSQAALAEATGYHKSFIAHLEAGRRDRVSVVGARAMLEVLGCEDGALFAPVEPPAQ